VRGENDGNPNERETFYSWTWLIDVLYMNLSDAYPQEHHILCCKIEDKRLEINIQRVAHSCKNIRVA
jgi:hypothetical protein